MSSLILSDGERSLELMNPDTGIWVKEEGLDLPVPGTDNTYFESPDRDGRKRLRTRKQNPEGSIRLWVANREPLAFWDLVDDLQELVESAHRNKGTLKCDLPDIVGFAGRTYRLESCQVSGVPVRGVLLEQGLVEVEVGFETEPFALLDPLPLVSGDSLSGPIDWFTVPHVPGHVPALGDLVLTEKSTQARNHVEVGVQHGFDPDNPEPVHFAAVTDLDGVAGSSQTKTGSNSTNTLRAGVGTNMVVICTTGAQPHVGLWKASVRVFADEAVSVRLSWRTGTAAWTGEGWQRVAADDWFDVDLGVVDVPGLASGHSAEFRVEAKAVSGVAQVDVDFIQLLPADNWTLLGGAVETNTQSGIVAFDDFSTHATGAITGKTPLLAPAGTWTGAGDTDDFEVDGGMLVRSAVSDSALNNGRYLRCGSGTATVTVLTVEATVGFELPSSVRAGALLRYIDTNNWLIANYAATKSAPATTVTLRKRVAGTETVLSQGRGSNPGGTRILTVIADAAGNVLVRDGAKGGAAHTVIAVIGDTDLATGGALASGGYGVYDAYTDSTQRARYYDNFQVATPPSTSTLIHPATNPGKTVELTHDTALTQNGSAKGRTPRVAGSYLTVPPSTRNGTHSRIVVKARRNERGLPDTGLTDSLEADLTVTPRTLVR